MRLLPIPAILLAAALCWAEPPAAERAVSGRLSTQDGLRILEVWGTPREAGFAHGYLCAETIVRLLDDYVLDPRITPSPAIYEGIVLPGTQRQFEWSPEAEAELRGILDGMTARLGERLRSRKLDRELRIEDLKICNTLSDWHGLFCSTFSAWDGLTADGETLTARNLDFPPAGGMEKEQIILVHRGSKAGRDWVGVTWPGLIGVYSAMNAEGVCLFMHDANGLTASRSDGFAPRSLILREALEAAAAPTFIDDVARVLRKRRVMVGNNIHASGPLDARRAPAAVFEYDANERDDGVTVRAATDNGPSLTTGLCCTNHLRLRRDPRPCNRYARLTARLEELTKSGTRLAPGGAMDVIRGVAVRETLHSIVCQPKLRKMIVLIPSIKPTPVELDVAKLLSPR